jgi:hypothetical protein
VASAAEIKRKSFGTPEMIYSAPVNDKLVVHCKRDRYDILIDRSTIWGNPFSHLPKSVAQFKVASLEEALTKYEEWLMGKPDLIVLAKRVLRGKVLGCWCRPPEGFNGRLLCHGQILARVANEG